MRNKINTSWASCSTLELRKPVLNAWAAMPNDLSSPAAYCEGHEASDYDEYAQALSSDVLDESGHW